MSVVVFGSINADLVTRVDRLPRAGETVSALSVAELPGGKGANQATASAMFGVATRMIGAVGSDGHAGMMIAALSAAGADTSAIARLPGPTGTAHVCVSSDGENQIVVVAGANALVAATEAWPGRAGDICLAQLELPVAAVGAMLAQARRAQALTILNAAPALAEAALLLADVDVLVVNETELAFYCGDAVPADPEAAIVAARDFLRRDGQWIVVTLGAAGIVAVSGDRTLAVPAPKVSVVDTTGAGDTFCGVLAAALSEGQQMESALRFACAAAALSVQRIGAAASMPGRAEIEAAMDLVS
ncbi:ribokinase [Sphingomonas abietis]|uniref:Ribokinase n=1 Tax=Sphingomonas abietis TaxID=3012344 RepID=A0ABY7NKF1_9SPHN|nr:ribokinase [Sphingomonas abietis]WBO21964.1 ribokinase [Sphingomonas abietis]